MKTATSHNYLLAQNKSLEYQLKITQLKLSKLQQLNQSLQEELHFKELEIYRLNQKIQKIQQNPKQIKLLKLKVEQLEKEFRLQLETLLKSQQLKKKNNNQNSSTFGDSVSESSRESKFVNIQKLERNSLGNQLDILQQAFNKRFQDSEDLKSIVFRFIKNISQGINLVVLIQNSKILFDELKNYLISMNKFSNINELFIEFLAESKQIFSQSQISSEVQE